MKYNFKDKRGNVSTLNNYMLAKTLSMFEYANLPDSLPAVELEKLLQTSGYAFVFRHSDGEVYACNGGLGGLPDVYGNPTEIIISNPALNLSKSFNIKDDGVLILNDGMSMGLMPHFNKYSSMMVENDINLTLHGFNSRSQRLISASDSKTKESAEHYVSKLIDGELTVIGENAMFDGVRVQVASTGSTDAIRGMLEYHQYLKSELYNEVGISQSHQLKRERLVAAEVEQERDSLYPLVYDMMRCRLEAVGKLNETFDLEVEVSFGSVWAVMMKEFVDGVVDNHLEVETETEEDITNVGESEVEVETEVETREEGAREDGTEVGTSEAGTPETGIRVVGTGVETPEAGTPEVNDSVEPEDDAPDVVPEPEPEDEPETMVVAETVIVSDAIVIADTVEVEAEAEVEPEVVEVNINVKVSEDVEVESTDTEEGQEQTDQQDGLVDEKDEDNEVDGSGDAPTEEDSGEAETNEGLLKDTDDENDTK